MTHIDMRICNMTHPYGRPVCKKILVEFSQLHTGTTFGLSSGRDRRVKIENQIGTGFRIRDMTEIDMRICKSDRDRFRPYGSECDKDEVTNGVL